MTLCSRIPRLDESFSGVAFGQIRRQATTIRADSSLTMKHIHGDLNGAHGQVHMSSGSLSNA